MKPIWKVTFKTMFFERGVSKTKEWTEFWKSEVMPSKSLCQGNWDFIMPIPNVLKVLEFKVEPVKATNVRTALDL